MVKTVVAEEQKIKVVQPVPENLAEDIPVDAVARVTNLAYRSQENQRAISPATVNEADVVTHESQMFAGLQHSMRYRDSWHRPAISSVAFLGAEIAEAYGGSMVIFGGRSENIGLTDHSLFLGQVTLVLLTLFIVGVIYLFAVTMRPQIRQTCLSTVYAIEQRVIPAHLQVKKFRTLLRYTLLALGMGTLFWISASYAFAASVPLTQMYEGHLLDSNGDAITAAHTIRLSYWNSADHIASDTTGSGTINTAAASYVGWQEEHTITPDSNGYFSVEMGSSTALPAMDALSASTLQSLHLQVEVKASADPVTAYELLDPKTIDTVDRSPVRSVPFALNADMLDQRSLGTSSGSIPVLQEGGLIAESSVPTGLIRDSFTIDTDDSSSSPTLQFGLALGRTLQYSSNAFRFNDDVVITGDLSISSSDYVANPHLQFGSGGTFDVSLFRSAADQLSTSDAFSVGGDLSATSSVTFSALTSCSSVSTDANGELSCGSIVVRKSVDETLSSSTALQDDDELSFAVGANEAWAFSIHILGNVKKNPDAKFAVSAPEGSTCAYTVNAEEDAQSSGHMVCGEASKKMNGTNKDEPYAVHGTIVSGATAGNVILQWAQNSSHADSVTVRAGSFLKAYKIP